MPRPLNFEERYRADAAEPFPQKNELFSRSLWDNELRPVRKAFFGEAATRDRPGRRIEDHALRNSGWYLRLKHGSEHARDPRSLYSWKDQKVSLSRLPAGARLDAASPTYAARLVKTAALLSGACAVGICEIDRRWHYSRAYDQRRLQEADRPLPEGYTHVVNIAVPMDYLLYRYTSSAAGGFTTAHAYSEMARLAAGTAQFIRQLGYRAIPSGNDTALSIPLAVLGGLGELGRNGLLVTPSHGPRVRLCRVYTDLPLACDAPIDFGVTRFCDRCDRCARSCSSGAITAGPRTTEAPNISSAGGALKWYVDGEACFRHWGTIGHECGNCIRVCPFNKPPGRLHDAARWLIDKTTLFNRFLARADAALGYGSQLEASTFWERAARGRGLD